MSSVMNYLFKKPDIKIKTVATYNHKSLHAEYGIKSLSDILIKHLTNLGQMWPKYLPLPTFTYNMFKTPSKTYFKLLNIRLQYLHKLLQDFKSKRLAMINKDRTFFQYNSGDLV